MHDGNGLYRLELAVQADTTLRQLDEFLRGMWLECCGHLREFTILGTRYSNLAPHRDDPNAAAIRADYWMEDDEEHMDVALADVMPVDALVSYEYDHGSPTELFLENLGHHGDLVGLLRPRQPWHGQPHRGAGLQRARRGVRGLRGAARAGGCFPRTPKRVSPYPSATGAGRRPGATNW